jgi:hypothetical protein
MWRTRKCAEERSRFRMCRRASRVGCRAREAMALLREGWEG